MTSGQIEAAQPKFACPACGGEAVWNPAQGRSSCARSAAPSRRRGSAPTARSSSTISSRRCARFRDDARGWQRGHARRCAARAATRSRCSIPSRQAQTCAVLRLGAARRRTRRRSRRSGPRACCRSGVREAEARDGIRAWYGKLWLAPSALKRRALTDTVRGVYLPYWTFDAQVEARLDRRGRPLLLRRPRRTSRTARRARARCSTFAGSRRPGTCRTSSTTTSSARRSACSPHSCAASSRFRRTSSSRTTPGYVAGWVVERYQIDLVGAAQRARAAMDAKLQALCAQQIPGDTYRNLVVRRRLFGADVQAHPRAGLAAVVHVRRAALPVRDERRHRRRCAASIRRARGRSRCSCSRSSSSSSSSCRWRRE